MGVMVQNSCTVNYIVRLANVCKLNLSNILIDTVIISNIKTCHAIVKILPPGEECRHGINHCQSNCTVFASYRYFFADSSPQAADFCKSLAFDYSANVAIANVMSL